MSNRNADDSFYNQYKMIAVRMSIWLSNKERNQSPLRSVFHVQREKIIRWARLTRVNMFGEQECERKVRWYVQIQRQIDVRHNERKRRRTARAMNSPGMTFDVKTHQIHERREMPWGETIEQIYRGRKQMCWSDKISEWKTTTTTDDRRNNENTHGSTGMLLLLLLLLKHFY